MSKVLLAASAYFLAWGCLLMFFPSAVLTLAGLDHPEHAEVALGVGIVAAVFGVGCAVVSPAPTRHWPIVLVGFLGNFLAPLAFVSAALRDDLPWEAVWLAVANLAWCVPFALILRGTAEEFLADGGVEREARDRMMLKHMTQQGYSLFELSQLGPTLVVFLRHAGCTFCREALSDISQQRAAIEAAGTRLAFVTMSEEPAVQKVFDSYGLGDLPRISDPQCELYRAFELRRGSWSEMFAPGVWKRGIEAGLLRGHGLGQPDGDAFRMPGVFLLHDGRVLRSFRHRSPADRPDYRALASCEDCTPLTHLVAEGLVS